MRERRRIWRFLLVIALVVAGGTVFGSGPAKADPRVLGDRTTGVLYYPGWSLVMDVRDFRTDRTAPVQAWTLVGESNQIWTVTYLDEHYAEIRAQHSGMCLDVANGLLDENAPVWQWPCYGGPVQQWRVERAGQNEPGRPLFRLRNRNSGKCLHLTPSRTPVGTQLVQRTCDPDNWSQVWGLSQPIYNFTAGVPTTTLAVAFRDGQPGRGLMTMNFDTRGDQDWAVSPAFDPRPTPGRSAVVLRPRHASGLCAGIRGSGNFDGQSLEQQSCDQLALTDRQIWYPEVVAQDLFGRAVHQLRNKGTMRCAELRTDTHDAVQRTCAAGNRFQQWRVLP